MRYHLFQKFFGKMVKIKEASFLSAEKSSFSASHCMLFLGRRDYRRDLAQDQLRQTSLVSPQGFFFE